MATQCGRSVFHVLFVSVYRSGDLEVMTGQCSRSVVQFLFVRVDIGVVPFKL